MNSLQRHIVSFAVVCCLFSSQSALAGSITFADNTLNFPSYSMFTQDVVGNSPLINGMTVNWNDSTGVLTNITISLGSSVVQSFDSLFINNTFSVDNNLQGWDYLVHSGGTTNVSATKGNVPGNGLYSVDSSYTYTTVNTWLGRYGHANGIDSTDLTLVNGTITNYFSNNSLIYDFSSLTSGIKISDGFSIGYTPWCANDVILASYKPTPSEVPEPATIMLFGIGLVTLATYHKKRMSINK